MQPLLLNEDFQNALDLLEKTRTSLFITGRAGTGKSTLLQLFRRTSRKKMVVLAPTGVAALNVQGQTIHSFFGFPPRVITASEARRRTSRKDLLRLYQNLEVLVIDEISMVRADLLDGIDQFLRVNRESFRPFGGVQVVFFGDLFQLPPVVTRDPVEQRFFTDFYESPYFFSAKIFKDSDFQVETFELRQVFRQESRHFLRLLEAVRTGQVDHDDLEDLNERFQPNFEADPDEDYITLCSRNMTADRINLLNLNALPAPAFHFQALIQGVFDPALYPTDPILELRLGAQVMFLKNDPDKNFVNGTIGRVSKIGNGELQIEVVRTDGERRQVVVQKFEWEIVRYKPSESGEIETETLGSFIQYPLRLAWAITIHKSQGKTFDRVLLDLGGGAFEHGQLYVALSRCRTLEGIVLRQKIRASDVITDERILDFYSNG